MEKNAVLIKQLPDYLLLPFTDYHLSCKDFIMPLLPMSMR
jgi:hypothetical protein